MRQTILYALLLLSTSVLWAVPAKRGPRTMTQPDGSQVTVYLHGDEVYNYFTDAEGYIMQQDESGFFVKKEKQTAENIRRRRAASPLAALQTQRAARHIGTPNNNASRGLFLLVNFTDSVFKPTNTRAEMDSMLNQRGYNYNNAPGSVRDYFIEQSGGRYAPHFDVFGPVTLNHPESYYGANVGPQNDTDVKAYQMIIDACNALDSQIDFTLYDSNNDGEIDFVYVIYAGMGANDGGHPNTIWPHQWYIGAGGKGMRVGYDGKVLNSYACGPELNGIKERCGIGILCHEFSHVLGLPDYYDTNYSTNYDQGQTPNEWSLMDYGSYNGDGHFPPNYSAHDKYFMGWETPTLLNSPENVVLPADNKTFRYITSDGTSANARSNRLVYYLENRQRTGWDTYLPGHGLVVWKVNYSQSVWNSNTPNNSANNPRYTLLTASGNTTYIGMSWLEISEDNWVENTDNDAFPSKHNTTSCTPFADYPITDITEQGGIIRFKMQGGAGAFYEPCNAYIWTATSALSDESVVLGDYSWDLLLDDATDVGYTDELGVQFGSEANPVGLIMLGTDATEECIVEKIVIKASTSEGGDATIKLSISGHQIGEIVNLTQGTNNYVFNNEEGYIGSVIIEIENTTGTVFLKSIYINNDDIETSVEHTSNGSQQSAPSKKIIDGQLIIKYNGKTYDALGQTL